jgi:hypothetical protein
MMTDANFGYQKGAKRLEQCVSCARNRKILKRHADSKGTEQQEVINTVKGLSQ